MQMIFRIILSLFLALQLSLAGAAPSHAHVNGELAGGTASIKTVTSADASKHGLQKSSGSNTLYDPVTQVNYAVGKDGLIYEVSSLSGFNPIPLSKPLTSATNRPPNLNVGGLDDLPGNVGNPATIRGELGPYVNSGNTSDISVATASVEVNGQTQHFISVSGSSWKGNAPNTVTIDGRTYNVVRTDSRGVPSAPNGNQTNFNHAEQKLFSHIQNNYSGQNANVNVAVQNTSASNPGMCSGCGSTSGTFASGNTGFNINIFEGSSGARN